MNEPLLPENDPDRRLAERIGAAREAGTPLPEDRLLNLLDSARATAAPDAERSARLWASIESQTRPHARIYRLWPRVAALAACLALAALAVALWLRQPEAMTYMAEAGGSNVEVTLPDGSQVTLRPGSSLTEQDAPRHWRLEGEAFFRVSRDERHTFEVQTSVATVQVLGTRFNVRAEEARTEVFLEEGRVRFAAAGERVELAPGQRSTATPQGLAAPETAEAEAALGWLEGRMAFRQQTLARVAAELERHFGITIRLPETAAQQTLTGTVVLADRDAALEQLGVVSGGRFERVDGQTYRFVQR